MSTDILFPTRDIQDGEQHIVAVLSKCRNNSSPANNEQIMPVDCRPPRNGVGESAAAGVPLGGWWVLTMSSRERAAPTGPDPIRSDLTDQLYRSSSTVGSVSVTRLGLNSSLSLQRRHLIELCVGVGRLVHCPPSVYNIVVLDPP
ncbi:unnamed protein product [Angiostrongylus costaricensis]|uniref:Uncharacterized protein n=1 Tax=Angiostrongylus costaricensis TaxID=334426 RepID=A0A0R3PN85_ANGCS|nr:unnamed protein product [Angiostrongylus costaricensis]